MEDPFDLPQGHPLDLPPEVLQRIPFFRELSKVLAWSSGPVNWDLARQIAVSVAAGERAETRLPGSDAAEIAEHVRIAELWLADAAGFPSPSHLVAARAATAVDWAEHATTAFAELIDPIAAKMQRALTDATHSDDNPIAGAVGQLAPMFMGMQAGQIIGTLAGEVTGSHDVGLPAHDDSLLIVTPAIDEIAVDASLDRRAVRQWVALRAAAHRMIYEGFPFVRAQFFASYHDYVSSLDVDLAEGLDRLRSLDMTDPARLQEALGDQNLFTPTPSGETAKAAERVTSLLGLIEAHVDIATRNAGTRAGDVAPIAAAFAGRASSATRGGELLESFIGLDRTAGRAPAHAFVDAVEHRAGWTVLNRMWEEPDAVPTAAEIEDPHAWIARVNR